MNHPNAPVTSSGGLGRESAYARYVPLPTSEDTVRGMFFNGILSLVKTYGGEPALGQCRALLGDIRFERSFISFSSYPARDFLRLCVAASQVLAPSLGNPEETARQLGIYTSRDFLHSMAGKTLMVLAGGSPQRLLGSISQAYRAAVSFGDRRVTPKGDKCVIVTYTRDFFPLYHSEGVLLAVLEALRVKKPQVRSRSLGLLDSEYEVTWE
ncbi:DUF2378 family protein [Hyalangium versicolor]|uniref:DUF2378 family protein n=1 Tax=Hyalangium versicolor TaxID=2861190 RepID=UPI001CCB61EB|nr:DUF2378 family protein [Hyalangium versicolor]